MFAKVEQPDGFFNLKYDLKSDFKESKSARFQAQYLQAFGKFHPGLIQTQ
jgi:hypothetical protein